MIGLQVVGLGFGLLMAYLTFVYYKKGSYGKDDFELWMLAWAAFAAAVLFPDRLEAIRAPLSIVSFMDLATVGGFMFFAVMIFRVYKTAKENEKKIDTLVRKFAEKNSG